MEGILVKDYEVKILHRINRSKEDYYIKVFIDGVEIKGRKNVFKHMVAR